MVALKILTIVGARPQFIKAAVVSRAIAGHNRRHPSMVIEEQLIHTGQHYDYMMSQAFFDELEIPAPAINLEVGSGKHGEVTGTMLAGIENQIIARQPDWMLVYGDTNSTLAGALAATKLQLRVAHVEAGLRSFNRRMPEEINRILTDHIADCLFCPSGRAKDLLAQEGITEGVYVVGDVMYDATLYYREKASLPDRAGAYAMASLHRAENTNDLNRLGGILSAMNEAPVPVILPLHPRTRKVLENENVAVDGQLEIMEPLSYLSMLGYLENCAFVITDSGGLQKEAYFFGKKCLTVREETEWSELVECGANRVVGAEKEAICAGFSWAMEPLTNTSELYGRGEAGKGIVERLLKNH